MGGWGLPTPVQQVDFLTLVPQDLGSSKALLRAVESVASGAAAGMRKPSCLQVQLPPAAMPQRSANRVVAAIKAAQAAPRRNSASDALADLEKYGFAVRLEAAAVARAAAATASGSQVAKAAAEEDDEDAEMARKQREVEEDLASRVAARGVLPGRRRRRKTFVGGVVPLSDMTVSTQRGQVRRKSLERVRSGFEKMDLDGDGKVFKEDYEFWLENRERASGCGSVEVRPLQAGRTHDLHKLLGTLEQSGLRSLFSKKDHFTLKELLRLYYPNNSPADYDALVAASVPLEAPPPPEVSQEELEAMFKVWDEDGSGEIDIDEFKGVMARLGLVNETEMERFFYEIDTDVSGAVTCDELTAWWFGGGMDKRGKDEDDAEDSDSDSVIIVRPEMPKPAHHSFMKKS